MSSNADAAYLELTYRSEADCYRDLQVARQYFSISDTAEQDDGQDRYPVPEITPNYSDRLRDAKALLGMKSTEESERALKTYLERSGASLPRELMGKLGTTRRLRLWGPILSVLHAIRMELEKHTTDVQHCNAKWGAVESANLVLPSNQDAEILDAPGISINQSEKMKGRIRSRAREANIAAIVQSKRPGSDQPAIAKRLKKLGVADRFLQGGCSLVHVFRIEADAIANNAVTGREVDERKKEHEQIPHRFKEALGRELNVTSKELEDTARPVQNRDEWLTPLWIDTAGIVSGKVAAKKQVNVDHVVQSLFATRAEQIKQQEAKIVERLLAKHALPCLRAALFGNEQCELPRLSEDEERQIQQAIDAIDELATSEKEVCRLLRVQAENNNTVSQDANTTRARERWNESVGVDENGKPFGPTYWNYYREKQRNSAAAMKQAQGTYLVTFVLGREFDLHLSDVLENSLHMINDQFIHSVYDRCVKQFNTDSAQELVQENLERAYSEIQFSLWVERKSLREDSDEVIESAFAEVIRSFKNHIETVQDRKKRSPKNNLEVKCNNLAELVDIIRKQVVTKVINQMWKFKAPSAFKDTVKNVFVWELRQAVQRSKCASSSLQRPSFGGDEHAPTKELARQVQSAIDSLPPNDEVTTAADFSARQEALDLAKFVEKPDRTLQDLNKQTAKHHKKRRFGKKRPGTKRDRSGEAKEVKQEKQATAVDDDNGIVEKVRQKIAEDFPEDEQIAGTLSQ